MKLSPYARLCDEDVLKKGDEIRFATNVSTLTQNCDESLDDERKQWQKVTKFWVGKNFGEFKKCFSKPICVHNHGKIDCRRLIT